MFVSEAARERVTRWYETFRAAVPFTTESRRVETSAGSTHVLIAGPEGAPPLVVLHGALTGSAHVMGGLASLVDRYRVYAVDVIGQSVMSAERRLDLDDDSYGEWLAEVANALGLERFAIFGASWGGFVALRAARHMPERVSGLVLLVPAGIVATSPWKAFTAFGLPMLLYRLAPNERRRRRIVDAMFTSCNEQWAEYFGEALIDYRLDFRIPPLATAADLATYQGPILAFGADGDLTFPGAELVARVRELAPRADVELFENCKHCPPMDTDFQDRLGARIAAFLGAP